MGFNRFYTFIVVRIVLIVLNGILLAFLIGQDDKIMASIISVILIIIQTIYLITYINKTNRNLAAFLLRIQSKDTAVNYDDKTSKSFKGLNISFDQINNELQQIRIDNEQKSHYLNTIVDHVKIGIIAFNDKGKIELFNPEALKILHCEKYQFMSTLEEKLPDFHQAISDVFNEKSQIIKLNLNSEILNLSIKRTMIDIGSNTIHIISFLNIKRELDHNELESWQKLIQVLNHEIMNSLTPITTLSKVIRRYIQKDGSTKKASEISDEIIEDIAINSEIIEERGKGLIDFIEVYKNITRNPELNLTKFKIGQTVEKIHKFYQEQLNKKQIKFEVDISPKFKIYADESLIEQMLINLIKNAIEALAKTPKPMLEIRASQNNKDGLLIKIIDNGIGIPSTEIEKIFIPFYSTKREGSGIGLSLSRQIMYLHKGSISVQSEPGIQTVFSLEF